MRRKPKIKNWLKLIFLWIPIVVILIWLSYHDFYKTYPIVPEPIDKWQNMYVTDATTGELIVPIPRDEFVGMPTVKWKSADEVQAKTFISIATGENSIDGRKKQHTEQEIKDLEQEKVYLEQEIEILEKNKGHLEENIVKLKEQNKKLSKISYDMQQAIIKFVETNRVRDMFASAIIGAAMSVVLTFILTRKVIREKIDNWLWEKIGEK